jgi:Spy/CpxP family protein refolding chaperone
MPHNPHRQGQRLQRGTPANKYGEKKEGKSIQLTPTMWDALDELQKDEKADSRSEALEDLLRAMPELIEAANDFYKYWLENLSRQLNNE